MFSRDRSCAGIVGLNARPARVDGGSGANCQGASKSLIFSECMHDPRVVDGRQRSMNRVGVPDQAPLMAMRLRIIDVMVIEEGSSVEHNSLVGEFARVDLTAFI